MRRKYHDNTLQTEQIRGIKYSCAHKVKTVRSFIKQQLYVLVTLLFTASHKTSVIRFKMKGRNYQNIIMVDCHFL